MIDKPLFPLVRTAATVVLAALAAPLAACGGLDEETRRATAVQDVPALATRDPLPSLIAADGGLSPSLPEAVPAGVRTRSGRYALMAQARALDMERRGDVLWLNVDACCGLDAADTWVGIAHGLRTAAQVSPDAPVLVRSEDLRLAAFVADRLEEQGERRVFLVTR